MTTSKRLCTALFSLVFSTGALAASYQEVDVKDGGTVTGKVTFSGTDQPPRPYSVTKDNSVCGTGTREIDFIKVNDGGLSDVVVFLDRVNQGKAFPSKPAVVDQQECYFLPYLSVMHNRDTISSINKDTVLHNIHTYEQIQAGKKLAKKTVFNLSQPEPGTLTKKVVLKRGNAMKLECDAHDFMHAFVFVAKNPYYAVVNNDGSFTIDAVPPGKYKIKSWHGTLGEQSASIEVLPNGTANVSFDYK
ncbi:carboxypeptidase regulatory-like domain-containing protein [Aestuariirhabdus sp. LZHN29]|uniref:carboxypeptidase regulatory-like domain-containing protein n=1 Tax=Aestuariirhabdus sp. LZHN29 TaxID=3417462 RepID=UPI003CF658C7